MLIVPHLFVYCSGEIGAQGPEGMQGSKGEPGVDGKWWTRMPEISFYEFANSWK